MGAVVSYFGSNPAASKPSIVIEFHSSDKWQLHFDQAKQIPKLMVVNFSASWCGPCKMMEPVIHAMAAKYTDVDFVKIDVDELPDVAREFSVQTMPTLVVLKQGKEVHRVVGANKDKLERTVKKHRENPKSVA